MFRNLVIVVLFSFICVNAQNNDVLKNVQNKYSSIKDFSADFRQGGLQGKLTYKSPDKYKVDLTNMLIISNGKTIYNYNKKENKVVINDQDNGSNSIYSVENYIKYYPSKSDVSVSSEGNFKVLTLTPKKNQKAGFSKIKIWVNKDNLINKVNFEHSGKSMQIELSNYKINQNLSDHIFSFTPPKGSNVIDLR